MKLSIHTSELTNVLKHVCRVSIKSAGDYTGQVLLDVTPSCVGISAQNGKQQISMSLKRSTLTVEATGAICVNSAKLEQVISSLPKDKVVTFNLNDEKLQITCGRSRFNLATLPAQNFPAIEFCDENALGALSLSGGVLSTAMRQVGFCAARNDVRFFLNGLLFDYSPNTLTLAATDGHRLGVTEVQVDSSVTGQFILPSDCIEDVATFAGAGQIEVAFNKQMVRFTNETGVLYSRLVDGKFPQYKNHVTNAALGQVVRVGRSDIASAVARVTLLSDSKNPAVRLSVKPDTIAIQSISTDVQNEANDVLPCDYSADPFEIGLNGVLAAELIRSLGGDEVDLTFNGAASGTLITTPSYPSHSFVLMPVRL